MKPGDVVGGFELEQELSPSLFVAKQGAERVLVRLSHIGSDTAWIRMAVDEARIAMSFAHRHLRRVIEVGYADEHAIVVYEHVEGSRLLGMDMPRASAIAMTMQLCEGLHYLHVARDHSGRPLECVHGDISPGCIILDRAGKATLLDYATRLRASRPATAAEVRERFRYLSPEQAGGRPLDARSDQYSIASLLWDLTVGEPRLQSELTDYQMIEAIRGEAEAPSRRRPDFPRALEMVLMRALAVEPDARNRSIAVFAAALAGCTN
ncbi:MAG TPA: protein kinase [Kofleriaceae bacterium]